MSSTKLRLRLSKVFQWKYTYDSLPCLILNDLSSHLDVCDRPLRCPRQNCCYLRSVSKSHAINLLQQRRAICWSSSRRKARWCQRLQFKHSESNSSKPSSIKAVKQPSRQLVILSYSKEKGSWVSSKGNTRRSRSFLDSIFASSYRGWGAGIWTRNTGHTHMLRMARCTEDTEHAGDK